MAIGPSRYRWLWTSVRNGLMAACAIAAGCGAAINEALVERPVFVSECDPLFLGVTEPTDIIVLEWEGGISPIYPNHEFGGLDLAEYETAEGGSLADQAELFKELVRREIASIYCDTLVGPIVVRNGPVTSQPNVTTLLLTQGEQPNDGSDIGEGEYDPCNVQHDNAALVFGGQILQLAETATFDEWVHVFANVGAHEIGHTLGFGHVARAAQAQAERPLYVELMLAGHTFDEMRRPQRIMLEQSNCPDEQSAVGRHVEAITLP